MKFKLVESNTTIEYDSVGNLLTHEQSEFFKNSRIRDYKGNLLVCHHGTNAEFDTFEDGDIGFHFGTLDVAKSRRNYKLSQCGDVFDSESDDGWYIKDCYLNIKNPLVIDFDYGGWDGYSIATIWLFGNGGDENMFKNSTHDELMSLVRNGDIGFAPDDFQDSYDKLVDLFLSCKGRHLDSATDTIKDLIISHGYDGFAYENDYEGNEISTSYIAFYPNQIKSITNKYPTKSNNINEEIIVRGESGDNYSDGKPLYGGKFYSPYDFHDKGYRVEQGDENEYGEVSFYYLDDRAKIFHGKNSYDVAKNYGKFTKQDFDIIKELIDSDMYWDYDSLSDEEKQMRDNLFNKKYSDVTFDEVMNVATDTCFCSVPYAIQQYLASKMLKKRGYDGAFWIDEDDLEPNQYQIWNLDKVKRYEV